MQKVKYRRNSRTAIVIEPPFCSDFKTLICDYARDGNRHYSFTMALDIACGDGKSTLLWSDTYQTVHGIDADASVIEKLPASLPDIHFSVGSADDLKFGNSSVDLVTIGLGFLWIKNKEVFYKEVDRVLRPGGVIAVFCPKYLSMQLDRTDSTQALREMLETLEKGKYWAPEIAYAADMYRDHILPFRDLNRYSVRTCVGNWTIDDLTSFISSWPGYKTFLDRNPDSTLLSDLRQNLEEIYTDEKKLSLSFHLCVMAARK